MIQVQGTPGTRRDEPPGFARLQAAFELQERAQAIVAPLLAELLRSIPRLRAWKGFSSGAWVVGVRTEAEDRLLGGRFARFDFEIRVDAAQGRVELTSRATVRSRDRAADSLSVVLDAAGEMPLHQWAERAALQFAGDFWAGRKDPARLIPAEPGVT
ncbi:MAG TPA: hypothetical protein VFY71_09395 [Planctomycetota bacterium]|nr:hypothetical protein [Planctomycetota bacterium]